MAVSPGPQQQGSDCCVNKSVIQHDDLPAFRLPNELLCQIFSMGTLPPDAATYPALVKKFCNTKRYLAQVCHHWRWVALECPDMWCNVVDLTTGRFWLKRVLKRSRDRSIIVYVLPGTKMEHIALIQPLHALRVRGLYADLRDPDLARHVLGNVHKFEGLKELNLVTKSLPQSFDTAEAPWSRSRPSKRFPLTLRRLYLDGPSIPLPPYRMESLSCLYIGGGYWGIRNTANQWLEKIRYLPGLQDLSLIDCIKKDDAICSSGADYFTSIHNQSSVISLPRLRELQLRGDHTSCGTFFRRLIIPQSCTLRVYTRDADHGPALDALISFLYSGDKSTSPTYPLGKLSLYIEVFARYTHLQIRRNGVVKQDIQIVCLEPKIDDMVSIVQRVFDATYNKFQAYGHFVAATVYISDYLPTCPERCARFVPFLRTLLIPGRIQDLRLSGTVTAYQFFNSVLKFEKNTSRGASITGLTEKATFPSHISLLQVHLDAWIQGCLIALIKQYPRMKMVQLIRCTSPFSELMTCQLGSGVGAQVIVG
ncbi:hypothetical protein P691DRAFT_59652 [Macrolepiota fuliginosa MF-IS2]|uniref:F-box domain-containing protein n=1 Tax=Macrolepiota fuliginosa MF-IS2 TaxID=1400762 RepID=A0A9P6C1W0_9AGAR|nr:hypothetical protein P691DRAFT_59652 [Macrolepiota fuliginosa MF-IS2]